MVIRALLIATVLVVGLGMMAIGVIAAVIVLRSFVRAVRGWVHAFQSASWPTATGTITRSVVTRTGFGRRSSFAAGLAYTYQVEGESYLATREAFASFLHYGSLDQARAAAGRYPLGSSVTVSFHPDHPECATLDRRRPKLLADLFIAVLVLSGATGAGVAGFHVAKGAVMEPPPLTDAELPPLPHQAGGLLSFVGGVAMLVAATRFLIERRKRALVRRLSAAPLTRIADVREGQEVAVFGRAEESDAEAAQSPFTHQSVVYSRARVMDQGTTAAEDVCHVEFFIADGTGELRVVTEDGTDEVTSKPVPMDAAVCAWVDQQFEGTPLPVPETFVVQEAHIAVGEQVLVVGRASLDADTGELLLASAPQSPNPLVFANESMSDILLRLSRGPRRTRILAVAAAAVLLTGLALLAW